MAATVIALVGPTAIGKTRIAVQVARLYRGEIISIDSMQVYRGMDIGTAKPASRERALVPHHLIDVIPASSSFSVAEFQRSARSAVKDIMDRGGTPFLVGGSGLYLRAVLDDMDFAALPGSDELRRCMEKQSDEGSRQELYSRLEEVDPASAARIGPHNLRRIVRALEVYETTGRPFSSSQRLFDQIPQVLPAVIIGLTTSRAVLRELIDSRVDEMFEAGLVKEVEGLLASGGFSVTARQALGYREVLDLLDNKASLEETIEKVKSNTRRYAKRQMTWFQRDQRISWIRLTREDTADPGIAARAVTAHIDASTEEKEL